MNFRGFLLIKTEKHKKEKKVLHQISANHSYQSNLCSRSHLHPPSFYLLFWNSSQGWRNCHESYFFFKFKSFVLYVLWVYSCRVSMRLRVCMCVCACVPTCILLESIFTTHVSVYSTFLGWPKNTKDEVERNKYTSGYSFLLYDDDHLAQGPSGTRGRGLRRQGYSLCAEKITVNPWHEQVKILVNGKVSS